MKIYIAGMITGNPNFMKDFQEVEDALVAQGHKVMNPAKLPMGFSQADYMDICFSMIPSCDAIVMLPNWKKSEGATLERLYGKKIGKLIFESASLVPKGQGIENLVNIVSTLREKDQWTKNRTFDNLKDKFSEEYKEVIKAIDTKDYSNLCEELGDLLFHIVLMSQIAKDSDLFSIEEVVTGISDKMTSRHLS